MRLLIIFIGVMFISCGFKGPPTPIFPASQNQIDLEIISRTKHFEVHKIQDKMADKK